MVSLRPTQESPGTADLYTCSRLIWSSSGLVMYSRHSVLTTIPATHCKNVKRQNVQNLRCAKLIGKLDSPTPPFVRGDALVLKFAVVDTWIHFVAGTPWTMNRNSSILLKYFESKYQACKKQRLALGGIGCTKSCSLVKFRFCVENRCNNSTRKDSPATARALVPVAQKSNRKSEHSSPFKLGMDIMS